jgi:hypothetical protein
MQGKSNSKITRSDSDGMKRTAIFALLLAIAACGSLAPHAYASDPHNVDGSSFGQRITLGPDWLFSPGDNLSWASPTYDDSHWQIVSSNKPLSYYGIHDIRYAWYRIHIHLRPGVSGLMVGTEHVFGSYEIYANGVRIGSAGRISGIPVYAQRNLVVTPVPAHLVTPQGELVLALRFALEATGPGGRGTDTPIGPGNPGSGIYLLSRESAVREISYVDTHNMADLWALACLSLLIGLVALAFYSTLRNQGEYLACAVFLFAESGYLFTLIWQLRLAHAQTSTAVLFTFVGIVNVALIEFVRLVLRIPRSRWLLILEIASFVTAFAGVMLDVGLIPESYGITVLYLPNLIVLILLPVLLVMGCLRGNHEAWVLLPAVLFRGLERYWAFFMIMARLSGLASTHGRIPSLHIGSYETTIRSVGGFVFFITILLFLVLRTVGIARERAYASSELEAARTVQQVLVPAANPAIAGFRIESLYKPAGQVGGDFYQIVPIAHGGALIVIGDVSGKGMPAAMTVSLLVGTFHTLAHYTQSPGEIVAAMNQRMLARSNGGFTTCLVLRADMDGTLTVANAGHLPPYRNGEELPVPSGLPLGLLTEATYEEMRFELPPGDQLTFVSDGVVEARNVKGELLGFERMAALSVKRATEIAEAAQSWGQEDDITVLTVARVPKPEAVTA